LQEILFADVGRGDVHSSSLRAGETSQTQHPKKKTHAHTHTHTHKDFIHGGEWELNEELLAMLQKAENSGKW
jgi:hypothetical protein